MSQKPSHESAGLTYSSSDSICARSELFNLLKGYQATDAEIERSLGLFIRGSLLARLFAIRELYEQIVDLPGSILDIGTWRGQTAVLCENLRAIFEPFHFNRRIICFDTFEGYRGFTEKDKSTELHREGSYHVGEDYSTYLANLLELHERNNAMGHVHSKHTVIKGDCRATIPDYFKQHTNEAVSLAFFDLNCFEPTAEAVRCLVGRLVPRGILAFWQLTRDSVPAEGTVYVNEILHSLPHTIHRSRFYPGLCYLVKQ